MVPCRADKQFSVCRILVHIDAPEHVRIAAELSYNEITQKTIKVEIIAIALFLIKEIQRKHGVFHLVVESLDEVPLFLSYIIFVRMLDGNWSSVSRCEHDFLVICIMVNLDQVAILRRHSVRRRFHLVT